MLERGETFHFCTENIIQSLSFEVLIKENEAKKYRKIIEMCQRGSYVIFLDFVVLLVFVNFFIFVIFVVFFLILNTYLNFHT